MSEGVRWLAGEPALRAALEPALLDPAAAGADLLLLHERLGRRRLSRCRLRSGETLVLKHFFDARRRHPIRGALARTLGLSAARREWRALSRLRDAGVPVPEPLALAVLPGGDLLLATRYLEGRTLSEALATGRAQRTQLLASVAAVVASLHAAGFIHRDLHGGNVFVTEQGPVLLDLQQAWPSRHYLARRRDLGELDHSLAGSLSIAERVRLRAAILGLEPPLSAGARRQIRSIGRASLARARSHAASRTRRSLRPGRRFARLRQGPQRGMRLRCVEEAAVLEALAAHRGTQGPDDPSVLKWDARSRATAAAVGERRVVVKEYAAGGALRRLADLWRGSPARRAWRGGHGLLARGIGAATPLAFLEQRHLGMPAGSLVVLEDLRPDRPADRCATEVADPARIVDALTGLAIALHRCGAIHGDLKASHVFLGQDCSRPESRLIDLEGVRFARHLGDRPRIRALAELNASLPDAIPDAARRRAFARYAAALPFQQPRDSALRRIVALSLDRNHRWTAPSCTLARKDS